MTQEAHWIDFQKSPWSETNEWDEPTPARSRGTKCSQTPELFTAASFEAAAKLRASPSAFSEQPATRERANWRELVPARFHGQFQNLSEELFIALAEQAPQSLAKLLLKDGLLDNAELTLAAEAMGRAEDRKLVRQSLTHLLKHQSALVREGAIYGLAELGSLDIRAAVATLARTDTHPGVQRAAKAVLADWSTEPTE